MGKEKQASRYTVDLQYSSDNFHTSKQEEEERKALYNGKSEETSALKKAGVGFMISFASDFYSPEPILQRVTKLGMDGREYELYNKYHSPAFSPICGHQVLEYLVILGVLTGERNG